VVLLCVNLSEWLSYCGCDESVALYFERFYASICKPF
jgi:hypothetical protein